MQRITVLFIFVVISAIALAAATSGYVNSPSNKTLIVSKSTTAPKPEKPQDPPGTIDGLKTPEAIPDRVAYMLLFRLISNRQGENADRRVRSYVRQMGLGKQPQISCPPSNALEQNDYVTVGSEEADIDVFIAAAELFKQRVSVLDNQAKEIKDRTWPNPSKEVTDQLTVLQRQKEAIADEIIASLPNRLSNGGKEVIARHINLRVKRLTKKFPGPPSLPNGAEWQSSKMHH